MNCYACERPLRQSNGIAVTNLWDGEQLPFHRICVLRIASLLDEESEMRVHHAFNVQAQQEGDSALRARMDEDAKSLAQAQRVVFGEAMAEEPTVEQHPIGWVPEDEEAI